MAEISCKKCTSPDCKGCNNYILETALKQGKFDALMNGNKTIHIAANVRENVKARWIEDRTEYVCSACGQRVSDEIFYMLRPNMMLPGFCPNPSCGAKMENESVFYDRGRSG